MTVQLALPHPPSANRLWIRAKKGMRKSEEYCAWLEKAGWLAKSQRPGKVLGAYKLSIHAPRPDRRHRDIDNIIKPISDLLQAIGVIESDHLCEMVSARWVTFGDGVTVFVDRAGVEE
jgi:crossover junction endodeoxyribonuclease RusA